MTQEVTTGAAATPAAPPAPTAPVLPPIPPEMLKTTRVYEALILFEPGEAERTWDKLVEYVKGLLQERHGGLVLKLDRWSNDSRKLAYEVKGLRRGTYMLVFFRGKPGSIAGLDRDLRLDEKVIRHMVVMHEKDPDELTGRVRERVPDDYEDEFDRRRDDFGYDEDDFEDY